MSEKDLSLLDLLGKKVEKKRVEVFGGKTEPPPGLLDSKQRMQLVHLEMRNVWCYAREEIEFDEGITVIAGPNGSGKSSLLESIFFALYGSKAGPAMGRSLAEVLRQGTKEGYAKIEFIYGDHRFTAQMALRRQGDNVISEREGCKLTRDDGAEWVGVENAAAKIRELLHMDRDDFTNCVYVRQGEIDRLIRAGEEERRQMIDRLLRLERLDSYAERAKEGARRAVNRRIDILSSRVGDLKEELLALEAESLHKGKARLNKEIDLKQGEIESVEGEMSKLEQLRSGYREQLKRVAEVAKQIQEDRRELEEKQERLKEREEQEEGLRQSITELGESRRKLEAHLIDGLKELALDAGTVIESLRRAGSFAEVQLLPEKLAESKAELEQLNAELQGYKERLAELTAQNNQLKKLSENLDAQLFELQDDLKREQELLQAERERESLLEAEIESARAEGLQKMAKLDELNAGEIRSQLIVPEFAAIEELELSRLKEDNQAKLEELREAGEGIRREVIESRTKKEEAERELADTEGLIKKGRCPTCKQPVTEETFGDVVAHLEEHMRAMEEAIRKGEELLEKADSRRASLRASRDLLDELLPIISEIRAKKVQKQEKQESVERLLERLEGLEEKSAKLEATIEENEEKLNSQQKEQVELGEVLEMLGGKIESAKLRGSSLEQAEELCNALTRTRDQTVEKKETRKNLLQGIGELRTDIAALEDRLEKLIPKLADEDQLRQKTEMAEQKLLRLKSARERLKGEHEELVNSRGVINSKIERLEKLKGDHERTVKKLEEAKRVREEVEEISALYKSVKKELRKRNIEALNQFFNSFFRLMDSGDSYNGVTITDDYEIEVELKNGQGIQPAIMSGGERALINIALRCAIHQVLAKAVRAMPLILDEPTIYLDRDRVSRLQFLLEDLGTRVGQVIVVSHEEGLVESADHEYRTEKGRDNISQITKVR